MFATQGQLSEESMNKEKVAKVSVDKDKAAQEEANTEEKGSLFVGRKTAVGKTACNEGDPFTRKNYLTMAQAFYQVHNHQPCEDVNSLHL